MKFKQFARDLETKIHKLSETCSDVSVAHKDLLTAFFHKSDVKDPIKKAKIIGQQSALMVKIKESGIFGPNLSYEAIGDIVTHFNIERVQKNIKKVKSETALKK